MNDYNQYGQGPIKVVLVHGGPGARGSLVDLATYLAEDMGVLEINQSKFSIKELIEEMHEIITETCSDQVVLLGHSWGAWLVSLYCEKYPRMVKKILLVGSGSFQASYAKKFAATRLERMSEEEKIQYDLLMKDFTSDDMAIKDQVMGQFGVLMGKLDTYKLIEGVNMGQGKASFKMYNAIWPEASELRASGALIMMMKNITKPIHVIQGDYDCHSLEGIVEPFESYGITFTYDLIPRCGHYHWREKFGKESFLNMIKKQINEV